MSEKMPSANFIETKKSERETGESFANAEEADGQTNEQNNTEQNFEDIGSVTDLLSRCQAFIQEAASRVLEQGRNDFLRKMRRPILAICLALGAAGASAGENNTDAAADFIQKIEKSIQQTGAGEIRLGEAEIRGGKVSGIERLSESAGAQDKEFGTKIGKVEATKINTVSGYAATTGKIGKISGYQSPQ